MLLVVHTISRCCKSLYFAHIHFDICWSFCAPCFLRFFLLAPFLLIFVHFWLALAGWVCLNMYDRTCWWYEAPWSTKLCWCILILLKFSDPGAFAQTNSDRTADLGLRFALPLVGQLGNAKSSNLQHQKVCVSWCLQVFHSNVLLTFRTGRTW